MTAFYVETDERRGVIARRLASFGEHEHADALEAAREAVRDGEARVVRVVARRGGVSSVVARFSFRDETRRTR